MSQSPKSQPGPLHAILEGNCLFTLILIQTKNKAITWLKEKEEQGRAGRNFNLLSCCYFKPSKGNKCFSFTNVTKRERALWIIDMVAF